MPLTGIKVIDFTQVLAGPYCTQHLADMGAQVIKVESAAGDRARTVKNLKTGVSTSFHNVNRNKKSLTVDLKHPRGKEIIHKLLETADVLAENFKPGAMERLEFGFEALHPRYPRLVYCSISGFGQTGPRREEVAFDQIIQGYSGVMGITGSEESGPLRVGSPIADLVGGTFATQGILLALMERQRSGQGQWVDVAMLDSMVNMLGFAAWEHLHTGGESRRHGNSHPTLAPSGSFHASDGYFNISLTGEVMWERFCRALGKEETWLIDPRFGGNENRFRHRQELFDLINERLSGKTRAEWIEYFQGVDVPCGPIYSMAETFQDPQLEARGILRPLTHPTDGQLNTLAHPVNLSRTPAQYHQAAPDLGQHNGEVLSELGFSDQQIEELRKEQVIGE